MYLQSLSMCMLNYFMYLILWKSLGLREKSFFLLSTRKLTLLIAWFTCKAINMLSGTLYSPIAEPKTWIVCVWDCCSCYGFEQYINHSELFPMGGLQNVRAMQLPEKSCRTSLIPMLLIAFYWGCFWPLRSRYY